MRWTLIALVAMAVASPSVSASAQQRSVEPDTVIVASLSVEERAALQRLLEALQSRLPRLSERTGLSAAALERIATEVFATHRDLSERRILDLVAAGADQIAALIEGSAENEGDAQLDGMRANVLSAARRGRLSRATQLNIELISVRQARLDASSRRAASEAVEAQQQALARDLVRSAGLAQAQGDYQAAAGFLGRAAEALPEFDVQERWAQRLNQAVALRTHADRFGGVAELRAALRVIDDHAAPLAPRESRALAWASTQMERGIILQSIGERGDRVALDQAVEVYRNALSVQRREQTPDAWASTQGSLGAALIGQGVNGRPGALTAAIEALEQALTVFTLERNPEEWATTQQNLALAHMKLGVEGDIDNLRQSISMFDALIARERVPQDSRRFAQVNLCSALWQLGEAGDRAALDRSVRECRAALSMIDPVDDRNLRAAALLQLGNALSFQAEANGDRQTLAESLAAYEEGLSIVTARDDLENWSTLNNNFASALQLDPTPANLARSVSILTELSRVLEAQRGPAWAEAQTNLGLAYVAQGDAGDVSAYSRAISTYDEALAAITPQGSRRLWNAIQFNRVSVLAKLEQRGDASASGSIVSTYEAIVANSARGDRDWMQAQLGLCATHLGIGQATNDLAALQRAADIGAEALAGSRRETSPILWAQLQTNLGGALALLGRRTNNRDMQTRALVAYNAALTVRSRDADVHAWARLHANIAYLQSDLAEAGVSGAREAAMEAADAAADGFYDAGDMRGVSQMRRVYLDLARRD